MWINLYVDQLICGSTYTWINLYMDQLILGSTFTWIYFFFAWINLYMHWLIREYIYCFPTAKNTLPDWISKYFVDWLSCHQIHRRSTQCHHWLPPFEDEQSWLENNDPEWWLTHLRGSRLQYQLMLHQQWLLMFLH